MDPGRPGQTGSGQTTMSPAAKKTAAKKTPSKKQPAAKKAAPKKAAAKKAAGKRARPQRRGSRSRRWSSTIRRRNTTRSMRPTPRAPQPRWANGATRRSVGRSSSACTPMSTRRPSPWPWRPRSPRIRPRPPSPHPARSRAGTVGISGTEPQPLGPDRTDGHPTRTGHVPAVCAGDNARLGVAVEWHGAAGAEHLPRRRAGRWALPPQLRSPRAGRSAFALIFSAIGSALGCFFGLELLGVGRVIGRWLLALIVSA